MRALAILLLCLSLPAHADLYRWIDPESGSVKISTQPPTDPGINAELVPFRNPAAQAPQAATATTAKPNPAGGAVAALEARWSELLVRLTRASPQDFSRSSQGWRQQLEAYEAVRVELDKLDPAGAERRRRESGSLLERLKQGFAAQFGPTPPGQQK
ncbi:MAG TPA: DUF4124 domain-containing protein [Burkholderiales bacterium]|nr:DUF4124 domain-containing protein [Burkholderiales bacterium]